MAELRLTDMGCSIFIMPQYFFNFFLVQFSLITERENRWCYKYYRSFNECKHLKLNCIDSAINFHSVNKHSTMRLK